LVFDFSRRTLLCARKDAAPHYHAMETLRAAHADL
jgi:hypothetical protein